MDKTLSEIVRQIKDKGYIGSEGRIENDPAFIQLCNIAAGPRNEEPETKKVTPVTPTPKGKTK